MKKLISLLIILIPLLGLGQTFEKFTQFGGTGDNLVFKSIIDNNNNVYIVGQFSGTINVEGIDYTAYGTNFDSYVAKLDQNGNFIWFKQIGSANQNDQINGLTISPDGTSLFITGSFFGSPCIFWDGYSLSNYESGTADAFLLSVNTSDGSIINVKELIYGSSSQITQSIKLDKSDIIIIGFVEGNGYRSYFNSTESFICNGPRNYYILSLNSSLELNWYKKFEGTDASNNFYSLDIDENGYYIAGMNRGTLTLDIATLTSQNNSVDMFLFKTDKSGNGEWIRSIKGSGTDVSVYATCDKQGHIYISGYYASTDLKVDSTATLQSKRSVPNKGSNDIFFAKYTTDGNLVWFDFAGSTGNDKITRLNNYGRYVVIAGQYTGAMTVGGKTITPKGGTDALGLLFNKEYNFFSPLSIGGSGTDVNQTCVIGNNGKFYFIGQTYSPKTFFTATDSMVNATPATRDVYIARYGLELTNNEPEVVVENAYRFKSTVTVDSLLTADSIATQIARVDTLKFNDGTSMSTASTGSTITASDGVYKDGDTVKIKYTEDHDSSLIWNFKENNFSPYATDMDYSGSIDLNKYYVQLSANRYYYSNAPIAEINVLNDKNKNVGITQITRGYIGNGIILQTDTTGSHYIPGHEPDTTLATPLHLMTEAQVKREIAAADGGNIKGTIEDGQIAFGSGTNTITGFDGTWKSITRTPLGSLKVKNDEDNGYAAFYGIMNGSGGDGIWGLANHNEDSVANWQWRNASKSVWGNGGLFWGYPNGIISIGNLRVFGGDNEVFNVNADNGYIYQKQKVCDLTDGAPTQLELQNCLPEQYGKAGQIYNVIDSTSGEMYQCNTDGINWGYIKYTIPN